VRAGSFAEREYYRFIKEWYPPRQERLDTIDITDHLKTFQARATTDRHGNTFRAALPAGCEPSYVNSHSGYHFDAVTFKRYQSEIEAVADEVSVREGLNQRTRPYRFDGDDFIEFIGWFVTEGSIHWRDGKRTATVFIAQDTPKYRRQIRALFGRLGISVSETPKRFAFGSMLFGVLLKSMCGKDSRTKRLPQFVWRLSTEQKRLLLDTLLAGDGSRNRIYYTISERLAHDVLRLALELRYKPRYTRRESGCWRVYLSRGNNCFRASKALSSVDSRTLLYQLVIEDFSAVIAGRDGRFQWIGVSGVT
jgi:DNA polymerase I